MSWKKDTQGPRSDPPLLIGVIGNLLDGGIMRCGMENHVQMVGTSYHY